MVNQGMSYWDPSTKSGAITPIAKKGQTEASVKKETTIVSGGSVIYAGSSETIKNLPKTIQQEIIKKPTPTQSQSITEAQRQALIQQSAANQYKQWGGFQPVYQGGELLGFQKDDNFIPREAATTSTGLYKPQNVNLGETITVRNVGGNEKTSQVRISKTYTGYLQEVRTGDKITYVVGKGKYGSLSASVVGIYRAKIDISPSLNLSTQSLNNSNNNYNNGTSTVLAYASPYYGEDIPYYKQSILISAGQSFKNLIKGNFGGVVSPFEYSEFKLKDVSTSIPYSPGTKLYNQPTFKSFADVQRDIDVIKISGQGTYTVTPLRTSALNLAITLTKKAVEVSDTVINDVYTFGEKSRNIISSIYKKIPNESPEFTSIPSSTGTKLYNQPTFKSFADVQRDLPKKMAIDTFGLKDVFLNKLKVDFLTAKEQIFPSKTQKEIKDIPNLYERTGSERNFVSAITSLAGSTISTITMGLPTPFLIVKGAGQISAGSKQDTLLIESNKYGYNIPIDAPVLKQSKQSIYGGVILTLGAASSIAVFPKIRGEVLQMRYEDLQSSDSGAFSKMIYTKGEESFYKATASKGTFALGKPETIQETILEVPVFRKGDDFAVIGQGKVETTTKILDFPNENVWLESNSQYNVRGSFLTGDTNIQPLKGFIGEATLISPDKSLKEIKFSGVYDFNEKTGAVISRGGTLNSLRVYPEGRLTGVYGFGDFGVTINKGEVLPDTSDILGFQGGGAKSSQEYLTNLYSDKGATSQLANSINMNVQIPKVNNFGFVGAVPTPTLSDSKTQSIYYGTGAYEKTESKVFNTNIKQITQTNNIQSSVYKSISLSVTGLSQSGKTRTFSSSSTKLINPQPTREKLTPSLMQSQIESQKTKQRQINITRLVSPNIQINTQFQQTKTPQTQISFYMPETFDLNVGWLYGFVPIEGGIMPKFTKRTGGRYTVEVRRRGKFKPIAITGDLSKALAIGKRRVAGSLARTYRIIGSSNVSIPKGFYGKATKSGINIIEKSKYALSLPSEKLEIASYRRSKSKKKSGSKKVKVGKKR